MPAKPLNEDQKADASRLRGVWENFRAIHSHATQEWLADQCGWKTQGAVNQYLLGKIPLNLPAVLKFANALRVAPAEISPHLASALGESAAAPSQATTPAPPGVVRLMKALEGLSDDEIAAVAKALEALRRPVPQAQVVKFKVGTPIAKEKAKR